MPAGSEQQLIELLIHQAALTGQIAGPLPGGFCTRVTRGPCQGAPPPFRGPAKGFGTSVRITQRREGTRLWLFVRQPPPGGAGSPNPSTHLVGPVQPGRAQVGPAIWRAGVSHSARSGVPLSAHLCPFRPGSGAAVVPRDGIDVQFARLYAVRTGSWISGRKLQEQRFRSRREGLGRDVNRPAHAPARVCGRRTVSLPGPPPSVPRTPIGLPLPSTGCRVGLSSTGCRRPRREACPVRAGNEGIPERLPPCHRSIR